MKAIIFLCSKLLISVTLPLSPYTVTPTSTSLAEGQCMQVTVAFLPHSVGDSSSELAVHYDTGECLANTQLLVRVGVMHSYFFQVLYIYIYR